MWKLAVPALLAAATISTATATQATAEPATQACTWTRTVLPLPTGFTRGLVTGSDGLNRYIGQATATPTGPSTSVLWVNGQVARTAPQGQQWGAVNKSGVMIGLAQFGGVYKPARFDPNGQPQEVKADPKWDVESLFGINDAGDMVGKAYVPGPHTWESYDVVVVWPAATPGTYRTLPTPFKINDVFTAAIDETGRVAADLAPDYSEPDHSWHSGVWDANGTYHELENGDVWGGGGTAAMRAGHVIGDYAPKPGEWDSTGKHIRDLPGDPRAMNANGLVGGTLPPATTGAPTIPVLWLNGTQTATLPVDTTNPFSGTVAAVSDNSTTAAGSEVYHWIQDGDIFHGHYEFQRPLQWRCT